MKFNYSIMLSLLLTTIPQNSWSMQPQADPQNQDILEKFLTDRNSKIMKVQNEDSTSYQILRGLNDRLMIIHTVNVENNDDYCSVHYTETGANAVPNPKKLFGILAQKFELQQNQELRTAIQPEHTYWVAPQATASNDFEDWVNVSEDNL